MAGHWIFSTLLLLPDDENPYIRKRRCMVKQTKTKPANQAARPSPPAAIPCHWADALLCDDGILWLKLFLGFRSYFWLWKIVSGVRVHFS